jgi:CBS domain-containing protein
MKAATASDVMVHQVFTVPPDLKVVDLEQELYANRISGAPVVDGSKLVGIVSRSDIDRLVSQERSRSAATASYYRQMDVPDGEETGGRDPASSAVASLQETRVREIMTPEVISVSPEDPISRVARLMVERRIHRVLVVEQGELQGLISSLDLVAVLASSGS